MSAPVVAFPPATRPAVTVTDPFVVLRRQRRAGAGGPVDVEVLAPRVFWRARDAAALLGSGPPPERLRQLMASGALPSVALPATSPSATRVTRVIPSVWLADYLTRWSGAPRWTTREDVGDPRTAQTATVSVAAAMIGVSAQTVYDWIEAARGGDRPDLPPFRVSILGGYVCRVAELHDWAYRLIHEAETAWWTVPEGQEVHRA